VVVVDSPLQLEHAPVDAASSRTAAMRAVRGKVMVAGNYYETPVRATAW
jgi:hypothetical protein